MKNIGKPCAGKPHARFDEGGQARACSLLYPVVLWFVPFVLRLSKDETSGPFMLRQAQHERN